MQQNIRNTVGSAFNR